MTVTEVVPEGIDKKVVPEGIENKGLTLDDFELPENLSQLVMYGEPIRDESTPVHPGRTRQPGKQHDHLSHLCIVLEAAHLLDLNFFTSSTPSQVS